MGLPVRRAPKGITGQGDERDQSHVGGEDAASQGDLHPSFPAIAVRVERMRTGVQRALLYACQRNVDIYIYISLSVYIYENMCTFVYVCLCVCIYTVVELPHLLRYALHGHAYVRMRNLRDVVIDILTYRYIGTRY